MLNIYATNTYKNGGGFIIGQLKKIDPRQLRFKHIVIVPDRVSMTAEQEMLFALGGSFNIRVLTFRRYAAEILPDYDYMSKQSALMALTAIVSRHKDKFLCYKKGTESSGFIESAYETICQFKYSRIPPEKIVCSLLPPQIRNKMADIKLLYEKYQEFLSENKYIDSAGKMEELLRAIPEYPDIKNSYFYIYDFDNFSMQEKALIAGLAKNSLGVTAACCHSEKSFHRYLFTNDLLPELAEISRQTQVKALIQKEYLLPQDTLAEQIGNYMYTYQSVAPQSLAADKLTLSEACDIDEEVENLARHITCGVRAGKKYGDYFVVASDADKYRQAIERVFAVFNIPFFIDTQFNLSNHVFVRYLVDYFTMRRNNNALAGALSFVKNPFFGGGEEVFDFENYCLKYNISYNYTKFAFGKKESFFPNADNVREKLQTAIDAVNVKSKDKISGYIAGIRRLAEWGDLQAKLIELEKEQDEFLPLYAKVTRQVYDKFNALLDTLNGILGEQVYPLEDFLRILTAGASGVNISVLPINADSVVVTNMAKSKKHDIKNLCLLGASQGAMPIVKRDAKLLSDANIELLGSFGIALDQKISLENKRERFNVYQLLLEPTDTLYVSYCKTGADSEGKTLALVPSDFFVQLRKLFGQGGNYPVLRRVCPDVFTAKSALSETVSNKRNLIDRRLVKDRYFKIKSAIFAEALSKVVEAKSVPDLTCGGELFFGRESTSVTKIEEFYSCPYRHFLHYGLNLKPRKRAELGSDDTGSILHAVLEKYIAAAQKNDTKEQIKKAAEKYFDEVISSDAYKALSSDSKHKYTLSLLKGEAVKMCAVVTEQLKNSLFANVRAEMRFGFADTPDAIEVNAGKKRFRLNGIVDRVDAWNGKCIVIDYKSGNSVDYGEDELYMGRKLQLLVYTRAAAKHLGLTPAGYYYFKLHDNFVEKGQEDKAYTYIGRTLKDADVIAALDTEFSRTGKSSRLGTARNKDGSLRVSKKLLSKEEMDAQLAYALKSIENAGQLMEKGCISVNPCEGVCGYCDYAEICGVDDIYDAPPRKKIDVNAQKLLEITK